MVSQDRSAWKAETVSAMHLAYAGKRSIVVVTDHVSFTLPGLKDSKKAPLCLLQGPSVSGSLDYVAAYNAAMLPSRDIQEVFSAVVKGRRQPRFSKL